MPNGKRRRFSVKSSVKNNIALNDTNKSLNELEQSSSKKKIKTFNKKPKSNKNQSRLLPSLLEQPVSLDSSHSIPQKNVSVEIMATSSIIDFYNSVNISNAGTFMDAQTNLNNSIKEPIEKKETRKPHRREKPLYKTQHRAKVRSPRRSLSLSDENKNKQDEKERNNNNSIDGEAGNRDHEIQETVPINLVQINTANSQSQYTNPIVPLVLTNSSSPSSYSIEDMCRICHGGEALSPELGRMISACGCRGTVGRVHVKCLERWLTESGKSQCELCGTQYCTRRVHKYGFLKALAIWALSQNAKQLMVDSLGIILLSPLAVVAAWLSGRTMAGLMTPELQHTTWPLASTFVLACMTLVCYYCWVVSAVTRHALGWWMWYRSQYEIRLELRDRSEEQ